MMLFSHETQKLVNDYEEKLNNKFVNMKRKIHHTNYNRFGLFFISNGLAIEEYLQKLILPCHASLKFALEEDQKVFFSSYLCYLLSSFIDYYAQELNILFELKLEETKKKTPFSMFKSDNGFIDMLNGNYDRTSGEIVTIHKVKSKIRKEYKINFLLEKMFRILDDEKISNILPTLRNYQAHNQVLLGRYTRSSNQTGNAWYSLAVSNDRNDEYRLFINFSEEVIYLFMKLIIIYHRCVAEKMPLKKDQEEQKVVSIKCNDCECEFLYPYLILSSCIKYDNTLEKIYVNCPKEECAGKAEVSLKSKSTIKKIHPQAFIELIRDLKKFDSFEPLLK